MHFTQKIMYMGFGCLLTLAGYILASVSSVSVAQSGAQDVTLGEITCRGLNVVDGEGRNRVSLGINEYGGRVGVLGKDGGAVLLDNDENGGSVSAHGKDGGAAALGVNEYGGLMAVFHEYGETVIQARRRTE